MTTATAEIGKYTLDTLAVLGRGAFGIVYRGFETGSKPKKSVAAKCIIYTEGPDEEKNECRFKMAENELAIFSQLKGHKNIVQLLDNIDDGSRHWIIMEFCDLGDLPHYFGKYRPTMGTKLKLMYECTNAIAYMHSFNPPIIHRDIKPGNILVMTQKGGEPVAKITDFGIGKLFEQHPNAMHQTMSTLAGTAAYMAPEFFAADGDYLR